MTIAPVKDATEIYKLPTFSRASDMGLYMVGTVNIFCLSGESFVLLSVQIPNKFGITHVYMG